MQVPAGARAGETFELTLPDASSPENKPSTNNRYDKQEAPNNRYDKQEAPNNRYDKQSELPSKPQGNRPPLMVKVPRGARPGDELTVQDHGEDRCCVLCMITEGVGEEYTVQVPAGARPGETFKVTLPDTPEPSSQDAGASFNVRVPHGARSGDELTVPHNGERRTATARSLLSAGDTGEEYTVSVPAGARPGDMFKVTLPGAAPPKSESSGSSFEVTVPRGARAGDNLTVNSGG